LARNQAQNRPSIAEAKELVATAIRGGKTVDWAMSSVGRHPRTYEAWRKNDPAFRDMIDLVRAKRTNGVDMPRLDFQEFRQEYLGSRTFDHQLNMIDVVEGRAPRWLHPSMTYERRSDQHVLINVPPDHAKTVTLTIDYVTYLICTNPNERIVLVSKTQELAKQMLWAVKQRLTHHKYSRLQQDFGPAEGFDSEDAIWQADRIYFPSSIRDPEEKDPTVQCVGIGGQIYGVRSTKIFLDDAVLLSNAHQHESQRRWLTQEVITRLGDTGQLIVVGTRVDPIDLYSELRNPDNYPDEVDPPWTYLGMPAVLEFADSSFDWVTLWPRSDQRWPNSKDEPDKDGLYPRWSGPKLVKRRSLLDPKIWSMVYMQQSVSSSAIFDPKDIRACINGNRTIGPMNAANEYHRDNGMQGLYVVCSMDPAMAGETATIAYAVDPQNLKRYVLEANRMRAPSPQAIRDIITQWTDKYMPSTWVVEKNAFQLFLTRDEHIRQYLANRGVAMVEHYSGNNKLDPDFGVASLAPLFSERMIELPSAHNSEGTKALVEQLITWRPGAKGKDLVQDLPMALWFAEIKAREVVAQRTARANAHANSKYVPRYRRGHQAVVRIEDYLAQTDVSLAS
jgi:hypothetical protein